MQLVLTPSDLDEYARLPVKWRQQVDVAIRVLKLFGAGQLGKPEAISSLGVSRATFDRMLNRVKNFGWRGLVPQYKGATTLPGEFVTHWKKLVESYQRKTAPAYVELLNQWRDRHPIPGYAGHPGWPNLPRGWDKRNLYRYQPSKLELSALREGLGRATTLHAPKLHTTRVGLWHLSHICWDDVWLDLKMHLGTQRQPCRALQIGALDVLSADRFTYGMRPELMRKDGTRARLTEADMRFALASQLFNYGISPRGTTMIIEHGTANIRDNVRDILTRGLGDLIQFDESGMTGKIQAIAGMGDGKGGGGNYRHKSWLESLHNLIHNRLSALPGQTGHDRKEPEFLGVLEREHEQLWRFADKLSPALIQNLRSPFMEYHTQGVPTVDALLKAINERTDHKIKDWAECGFMTRDYRLTPESNDWMNEARLLALPPQAQHAMTAIAQSDERCWRPRRLSPAEVFDRGHHDSSAVMKVPLSIIAEILYIDLAQPQRCEAGEFVFEDQELAPGPLAFEGRITRTDGREEELRDGETYELVVNPFDPAFVAGRGSAFVFAGSRQRGAFLGLARRVHRLSRSDAESAREEHGRINKRMAEKLAETRGRNIAKTHEITERKAHNLKVIEDHEQALRDRTRQAEDALATALSATNNTHDTTTHEDTEPDLRDIFR